MKSSFNAAIGASEASLGASKEEKSPENKENVSKRAKIDHHSPAAARQPKPDKEEGQKEEELRKAAKEGDEGAVEKLLDKAVDVDAADQDGRSALWIASCDGHDAVVKLLLNRRANPDLTGFEESVPPLVIASQNGHEAVARLLLDRGATVDHALNGGWTALHATSQEGHEAVVRLLLDRGASVNLAGENGVTALHEASRGQYVAIARLLLDHGANVNAVNSYGQTPLLVAFLMGHEGLARLLLSRGANNPGGSWNVNLVI